MSMILNLGEGYYGVEAPDGAMSPAVLERMEEAYAEALAISDDDIIITESDCASDDSSDEDE